MRKRTVKKAANFLINLRKNPKYFSFDDLDSSPKWVQRIYYGCAIHQLYLFGTGYNR